MKPLALTMTIAMLTALGAGDNVIPGMKYYQAIHGKIAMPAAISNATSIAALMPILATNADLYARGSGGSGAFLPEMAAIRRIGQLGGTEAVAVITQHFYAIPYEVSSRNADDMDTMRPQKYECIRALGRMNSDAARDALLAILQDYWKKGPRPPDSDETIDTEFPFVMGYTALYLNRWAGHSNVFATVAHICTDARLPFVVTNNAFLCFPSNWDEVYALYLRGIMATMLLTSEWQKCMYACKQMYEENERLSSLIDLSPDSEGVDDVGAIRLLAFRLVLEQDISSNTLFAVKASMQARMEDAMTRMLQNQATEWVDGEKCASQTQPEAFRSAERDYDDAQHIRNTIDNVLDSLAARDKWRKHIVLPNVSSLRVTLSNYEEDTLREIKQCQ